jgi:peptidyl-prolyl cis-trans isomerase D
MMQFFRSSVKLVAAIFAILMFIFMVTSVDWSQITGGSRSEVGKINGTSIPLNAYQTFVQQAIDQRQRQSKGSLTAEEIQQIRDDVWEQIIQQRVLETEYHKRKISANAQEIAEAIRLAPPPEIVNHPDFQTDGKFDEAKYQRWLQSSIGAQYVPQLEVEYREQIMRQKLLRVVTSDVYLSDPALWQSYRDANEAVTIELVPIIGQNVVPDSSVPVTPAEAKAYYDQHAEDFRRPRTALLSYVSLNRLPDASDTAAALLRAQRVRKEIADGAPFAEIAKRESSDSVSGAKGGELGEAKRGSYDPAFEKVALSQPIGTLSQPVLSAFGYHLIETESRSGDKLKARHILIPIEVVGAHRDRLDAQADSLESLGAEKLDPAALDTVARLMGLKIGSADPLTEGGRVQVGIQSVPEAGLWAFQAKQGETSKVIEVPYAYFLFRVDSLHPAGVPPYESVKGQALVAARLAKKDIAAKAIVDEFSKRLGAGNTLEQAAAALKLPHQPVGPFTRINPPFPDPVLVGAAFGLDSGKVAGPIATHDGSYFFRLLKRTPADSVAFAKTVDDLRAKQIRSARQDRIRNYMQALRGSAKITDRRDKIFATDAQTAAAQAGKKS